MELVGTRASKQLIWEQEEFVVAPLEAIQLFELFKTPRPRPNSRL